MSQPESGLIFILEAYIAAQEEWMRVHGSTKMREELNLDVDSLAGEFWRSGYFQALHDLQSLIRQCDSSDRGAPQGNSLMDH